MGEKPSRRDGCGKSLRRYPYPSPLACYYRQLAAYYIGEAREHLVGELTVFRDLQEMLPYYELRISRCACTIRRLRSRAERAEAAIRILREAACQGHSNHWNVTGQGCAECGRVARLMAEADAVLYGASADSWKGGENA